MIATMRVPQKTSNLLMGTLFLLALFGQIDLNLANSARRPSSLLSNKPIKRDNSQQPISSHVEVETEDVTSPFEQDSLTESPKAEDDSSNGNDGLLPRQWIDLETPLPVSITAEATGDLVLKCMAVGSPPPSIYWLKDGKPVENTAPFDTEKLQNRVLGRAWFRNQKSTPAKGFSMAKISSILPFRCVRPEDEGQYTCVADNGVKQASSTTMVSVKRNNEISEVRPECEARSSMFSYAKKGKRGVGALILSHETLHMEAIGNTVVLPCRVSGRPRPEVTWLDPEGKPVLVGKKFQIHRGDLVIRKVSWGEMGEFTCVAANPLGTDTQSTFLYPLANEESS